MKISIVTPTHDPQYLLDAWASLQCQAGPWEWVLVPNAAPGGTVPQIPEEIRSDPRVVVCPTSRPSSAAHIGYLKLFGFKRACGEILLELDHDDLLVPGILERIRAKARDGNAGFFYSDTAVFVDEGTPVGYDERFGWETYEFKVYGRKLLATRNFEITARSLCEVYYAPDHVRCWTRKAYDQVGGHDPELHVGDDHDLLCRTYLMGIEFAHVGGVGYLYRRHSENTVATAHADIRRQQDANRCLYIRQLIQEWCRRNNMHTASGMNLEIPGRGHVTYYTGMAPIGHIRIADLHKYAMPEVLATINTAYCSLAPGGWLSLDFPDATGPAAYSPLARSFWSRHTLDYFTREQYSNQVWPRERATLCNVLGVPPRFQLVRCDEFFPVPDEPHAERNMKWLQADLLALKGQRVPGRVYI